MRLAIGAGRGRLIRQLLSESLLLALAGAAAGILLAQWADTLLLQMVSRTSTGSEAIQVNLRPDARMLAFTLGVAVLSAILFGLIPALRATRLDLSPILKSTTSGLTGENASRRLPATKVLVIAQVAISLILLVAAGLFVHSLSKLSEVNLGYKPRENLLLFQVDGAPAGYKGPANLRLQQELLEKFSGHPRRAGRNTFEQRAIQPFGVGRSHFSGRLHVQVRREVNSRMDHVGPGYFSTVGIPILIGREIGASGQWQRASRRGHKQDVRGTIFWQNKSHRQESQGYLPGKSARHGNRGELRREVQQFARENSHAHLRSIFQSSVGASLRYV